MPILRYTASADNTITNAFYAPSDSETRATGSNMGASDLLEVYSIYNRLNSVSATKSSEMSRILIKFPIDKIKQDRTDGKIPAKDSVSFYLNLYNARHVYTTPQKINLTVLAVSSSWEEGRGLDMATYGDVTQNQSGSNWINANGTHASASATIKIINGTRNGVGGLDDGSPPGITLTSTDGTERTYEFQYGGSYANGASAGGTTVRWYGTGETATTQGGFAALLKTAIEGTAGHAGKLTVTLSDDTNSNDTLTIKQTTSGIGGNTVIPAVTNGNASDLTINGGIGATRFAGGNGNWASVGGDYHASPTATQYFDKGVENMKVDVTTLVEQWITGLSGDADSGKVNHGFGIKLSDAQEAYYPNDGTDTNAVKNPNGAKKSYFTKMFFGRSTEFFYKKPVLEAQFNDIIKDDRNNFHIKSSLLPSAMNYNSLYFYNYAGGQLQDIGGSSATKPKVKLYSGTSAGPVGAAATGIKFVKIVSGSAAAAATTAWEASRVSKGIYRADVCVTGTLPAAEPYLYDVWLVGSEEVLTGSAITPIKFKPSQTATRAEYVISMPNLRKEYHQNQTARFRLYAREKNWSPNVYSKVKSAPENITIPSASYRVLRTIDNFEVLAYDYASTGGKYSRLSYDGSGSYFDLPMSIFETGYQYTFRFSFYDGYAGSWVEQPKEFKFRVIK